METVVYKNEISEPMADDKFSTLLMTLTRKCISLSSGQDQGAQKGSEGSGKMPKEGYERVLYYTGCAYWQETFPHWM